jgi:hypothetical protein
MKRVVIAFVAGALLMVSGQAMADSISRIGKKVGGEAAVYLNGKQLSDAIIVDDKSYAPVRDIAEAFGADVGFEGATTESKAVIDLKTETEGGEVVPEVPTETLSPDQIAEKINNLKWTRDSHIRKIDLLKDAIRRADDGQFKPTTEEYAQFKTDLAYYESELVKVENEIEAIESAQ